MISIIVPVYNVEPYLDRCIRSIINQTYSDLEIILIDDGSTDKSGEISEKYKETDNRIQVIHTSNKGLSSARNTGLRVAKGDYIGFVDSDDFIAEDMYETLMTICSENKCGVACGGFQIINGNDDESGDYGESDNRHILTSKEFLSNVITGRGITYSVWDRLYNREIIKDLWFPEGKCYEDVAFTTKIAVRSGRIGITDKTVYYYCIREKSISHDKDRVYDKRLISDRIPIQMEAVEYLEKEIPEIALLAKAYYYQELLYYTSLYVYEDYRRESEEALRKWKPRVAHILKFDVSCKDKLKLILQAKLPELAERYYRWKSADV